MLFDKPQWDILPAYFHEKWGGSPYHETFTTPFDAGGDPSVWKLDIDRLRDQTWKEG